MKKIILYISLFLTLAGCATAYQPMGLSGGYEEFKLANDSYMVRFAGNEFTRADLAYTYAIRRSAELTKQQGYKYFSIVKSSSVVDRSTYVTPVQAHTQSNYYGYSAYSTTTVTGGNVITTEQPTTSFVVKFYKSRVKGSLDADIILSNFHGES